MESLLSLPHSVSSLTSLPFSLYVGHLVAVWASLSHLVPLEVRLAVPGNEVFVSLSKTKVTGALKHILFEYLRE